MKGFEIDSAQLRPPRSRIDRSATLSFETGEISGADMAYLHEHAGQLGKLFFIPEGYKEAPKEVKTEGQKKTDSERLRNVLYRYWEHKTNIGESSLDFETFRHKAMESVINQYKALLPEV